LVHWIQKKLTKYVESVRKTDTIQLHMFVSQLKHSDEAKINNSSNDNNNKGLEIYSINLGVLRGSFLFIWENVL